jgi:hypothetical protein
MFRRLTRSAIVLAVLVAAYNAYALLAVPLMEPSLELVEKRRVGRGELDRIASSPSQYQQLLSNYFPQDHWSQTRPPKVIASATEQAMLVFDDFTRRAREGATSEQPSTTLVDIDRIALLVFPTPPREGILPPRDAIVLEAPGGAHLEFDDFRPEIGRIGQILRGEFPGPIHIHSDMNQPTPDDDLIIQTADLHMNTKLMYTSAPVRFQMGQNTGGGTELEIRFLADEHNKPGDPGLKIAGIDSLEIRRDVKIRLELDTSRLLPGGKDADANAGRDKKLSPYEAAPAVRVTDASALATTPPPAKPPVEVTCTGPFTFDFVRHVASLDRDVELRQIKPNGPSNQVMCARLDIHFAPKLPPSGAPQPAAADPDESQRALGQLEPVAVVAEGHPVVVTSSEQHAQARGDRIQIALRDQRVRISGGSDAMLVFGSNAIQAPIIDYQHPARDEATAIGRFRATGPGSLRYVVDEKKPNEVLQAQWLTSVQLGREKGQPVLALDGRPKISFASSGSLTADQIRMYLRELEGKGTEGLTIGGSKKGDAETTLRLAPDRLLATGRVEVAAPQFTGRTQQLSTVFRIAGPDSDHKPDEPGTTNRAKPLSPASGEPTQTYNIDSDQMRLDVLLKGQSAVPTSLECAGHIVLREALLSPTNQQPLEIRGGHLTATQLDTKSPHITLRGAAPGQAAGAAQALLAGRGMTMQVDAVEADGGSARVWSDGPGKATLLVARNLQGQAAATPMPMDVIWQKGFRFDGQTITFSDGVVVSGMDSTLHCDQLAAKLATKLQPGQPLSQVNMNPSEIECTGRVTIENITRDAGGVTSRAHMQLARLSLNQQTGAIGGTGPGIIRATRFGTGMDLIPRQPGGGQAATSPAVPASAAGNKLHFLRVDFHSGLDGNMYVRELTFRNRIRAVYGPVDSWEHELDLARPETLTPDSMTLSCDDLRLNEDPLAARTVAAAPSDADKQPVGPIQMQAKGNVRIAGQIPSQGEFTVQADRASYEQLKDAFILEGDTRTPAKLWRRNATGQNSPPLEARKIRYSRATNEAKVDGIQYFEITPQDLEHARRPKEPPK